jgi:glutaminyl-tRNA synthetase
VKDEQTGEVVELRCTYDPDTRGGEAPDGRKVRGTLHWVSAGHSVEAEVRLFEHLLGVANLNEEEDADFKSHLNPHSVQVLKECRVEPSLASAEPGSSYQFLRQGYFCVDSASTSDSLVFNRTVALRDTWSKIEKAGKR